MSASAERAGRGWLVAWIVAGSFVACHPQSNAVAAGPHPQGPRGSVASEPAGPTLWSPPSPSQGPVHEGAEQRELAGRFGQAEVLARYRGQASYYSDRLAGRATASGERYDPRRATAAHRTLPFGSIVRVRRVPQGHVVHVRITDRGPFGDRRRIIDVSKAAAERLEMLREGVVDVVVEVVHLGPKH